eukprot:1034790-Pyramimonas_sp.AAC.1
MSSASKVTGMPPGEAAPPGAIVRPPGMPPMMPLPKHKPAVLVLRQPDGPPPARLRTPLPPPPPEPPRRVEPPPPPPPLASTVAASSDDESNKTRASRSGSPTSPVERDAAAVG